LGGFALAPMKCDAVEPPSVLLILLKEDDCEVPLSLCALMFAYYCLLQNPYDQHDEFSNLLWRLASLTVAIDDGFLP
jgi:hypothetical protein